VVLSGRPLWHSHRGDAAGIALAVTVRGDVAEDNNRWRPLMDRARALGGPAFKALMQMLSPPKVVDLTAGSLIAREPTCQAIYSSVPSIGDTRGMTMPAEAGAWEV
jgi:hypothetical protein